MNMVYLGADHRGFELKEKVKGFLNQKNISFVDLGAEKLDPADDYPLIAQKVSQSLKEGGDRGILICGSGHGVCVAANKFKGIRASLAVSKESIAAGRAEDDLNILCLAAKITTPDAAAEIIESFLNTNFSGQERHQRRLDQIKFFERNR